MPPNLLMVFLSFVIGIFLTNYIRSYDVHEKEPLFKMFLVVLWGGIWSIALSILAYWLLGKAGIGRIDNLFGAFFVIGPVEEAAKFLALLFSYFLFRKEMNEPTDGLIYMTCVALGFSLIENYFYATHTPHSGNLLFIRLVISTPLHIFSSIFMGIAFFEIVKLRTGVGFLLASFCYAILVHGLFDAIIFSKWILPFLFMVIWFSRIWALSLLSYTTAKSPFRQDLKAFVENSQAQRKKGLECLNCGSLNDKDTYSAKDFSIQKCDQCPRYIATKYSLFKIFHVFGSTLENLTPYYEEAKFYNRQYSTLIKANWVSDEKNLANFLLEELNDVLNELNRFMITNFERYWWFPKRLRSISVVEETKNGKATGGIDIQETLRRNPIIIATHLMAVIVGLVFASIDQEFWLGLSILGYPLIIFLYLIVYLLVKLVVKKRKA